MKNTYEIDNIMDTMSEEVFEGIMNLLDAYWTSGGAVKEAAELTEAIKAYDLTLEEITRWDAE